MKMKSRTPDQRIDEGSGDSNPEPRDQEPDECCDVLPDDVLDHPALQLGHIDGEEGSDDQDQSVKGEEAGLIAPDARYHDLRGSFIQSKIITQYSNYGLTFRRIFS